MRALKRCRVGIWVETVNIITSNSFILLMWGNSTPHSTQAWILLTFHNTVWTLEQLSWGGPINWLESVFIPSSSSKTLKLNLTSDALAMIIEQTIRNNISHVADFSFAYNLAPWSGISFNDVKMMKQFLSDHSHSFTNILIYSNKKKSIYFLFSWKKCCIGGSAIAIVAPQAERTLTSGQRKLTTFWRGIPPKLKTVLSFRSLYKTFK